MKLIHWLFCCRHKHTSRVFTPKSGWHYIVCLDCGEQIQYDWRRMKVVT